VNLLLDTHLILWWMADHPALPPRARELIADGANDVAVSVASLWEIAIKAAQGKLHADLARVEEASRTGGFTLLSIEPRHVRALGVLPAVHGDPFDRMLVAQSRAEPRYLVTADRALRRYGETVMVV
jgi:PIN domain nuclease of toxin-antitoxin system